MRHSVLKRTRGAGVVILMLFSLGLTSCESEFDRRVRLEREAQEQREAAAEAALAAEQARIRAEELRKEEAARQAQAAEEERVRAEKIRKQEEARLEKLRQEQEAARVAEARRQRYLNESLPTGNRPFSTCWRSGWSGSCGVEVTAAGTHEVLVTVKKRDENGSVVGHVYVAAGGTGTIELDPATYQVFFSQGKGWDPEAANPIPNCQKSGWFVDFYGVSKDDPDYFPEGRFWTYELQPVQVGNFNAEESDTSEAF